MSPILESIDAHLVREIPEGEQMVIWHDMRKLDAVEVELTIGAHANVLFVGFCPEKHASQITITQRAQIGERASIQWLNVTFGGGITHTLQSECVGSHAQSDVSWIFAASHEEKQSLSVTNTFASSEGKGDILMKGIAEQKAHIECKGCIDIGLKGKGTNAYLTQDVLMLDETAKIDAVPGLEIKTNDVKASHSATVSRVSPEDLFYFASRGIEKQEARAMYIAGFLQSAFESLKDQQVRDRLQKCLDEYLSSR